MKMEHSLQIFPSTVNPGRHEVQVLLSVHKRQLNIKVLHYAHLINIGNGKPNKTLSTSKAVGTIGAVANKTRT
jgi:hypothetical protein